MQIICASSLAITKNQDTEQLKSRRCKKAQYEVHFTQRRSSMCVPFFAFTQQYHTLNSSRTFLNNLCLIFAIAVLIPLNTKNDSTTYPQWGGKMLNRQLPERWFDGREHTFWPLSPNLTSAPSPPTPDFLCGALLNFRFTFRQCP